MLSQLIDPANYAITPHGILLLMTSGICVLLGLVIVIREQSSAPGRVYFLYTLTLSIWFLGFFGAAVSTRPEVAQGWIRFGLLGVACIPAVIYHFTVKAVDIYVQSRKWILANWLISAFFLMLCLAWDGCLEEPYLYSWGYYPNFTAYGAVFIAFYVSVIFVILRLYWNTHRRAKQGSSIKHRAKLFFIGASIGSLGGLDFLPALGIALYPIGYLFIILLISLTTYVTWRYRLIDITPAFAARQIIETMTDALLVIDKDGIVRVANAAASKLFGYSVDQLLGKSLSMTLGNTPFVEALKTSIFYYHSYNPELMYITPQRNTHELRLSVSPIQDSTRQPIATVCVFHDITDRKLAEMEREKLIKELQNSLAEIKTLRGIIPICSVCKKIRDDKGYWKQVETYIQDHSEAEFSHSICPECALYPEFYNGKGKE